MNIRVLTLLLAAMMLAVTARPVYATSAPMRVAVLPTRTEVYVWGWRAETVVTSLLEEAVAASGAILVERGRLDTVLEEQILARTGLTDPQGVARLGGLLGADLLVLSTVVEASVDRGGMLWSPAGDLQVWKATLGLAVRLVSTTDGRVLFTRLARSEVQTVEFRATVGGITVGAGVRESLIFDRAARDALVQIRSDLIRALATERKVESP